MKLVCESIEDILKPKSPERIKKREEEIREKYKNFKTFDDFIDYAISLNDLELALNKVRQYIDDVNPEIDDELGEIPGHDKYAIPWRKFVKYYNYKW
jgi:hypothetical protein